MSVGKIILKFEAVDIQGNDSVVSRIVGFVKAKSLLSLFVESHLGPNPRLSKTGKVTDAIRESISNTPSTLPYKTKGILVAASQYRELDRKRFEITFSNPEIEGILDGGHNMLAIGIYILGEALGDEKAVEKRVKRWEQMIELWEESQSQINAIKETLDFVIPVEILVPTRPDDEEEFEKSLLEICEARNNNVQLTSEAASNKKGLYDELKEVMPPIFGDRVEWKPGEGGDIKVRDIVALSWIPLSKLDLPNGLSELSPQTIYVSKDACSKAFDKLMTDPTISDEIEGGVTRVLKHALVKGALKLVPDLMRLYDKIYEDFPEAAREAGLHIGKRKEVQLFEPQKAKEQNGTNAYGHERKYLKTQPVTSFSKKAVEYKYPEGWIVPLCYGLQALVEVSTSSVKWKTDPYQFLNKHLPQIIEQYQLVLDMANYDPQKVGKNIASYKMALGLFEQMLTRK